MGMRIDIATLFPEMCERVLGESIIGRAQDKGEEGLDGRDIDEAAVLAAVTCAAQFVVVYLGGDGSGILQVVHGR